MNNATYTVLRWLGINDKQVMFIMDRHMKCRGNINMFEEIRHHELRYIFPKVYTQNKYLGA